MEKKKIRLWYFPVDGGDGSVSVAFYHTQDAAKQREADELEIIGYGWGEDCTSYVDLEINDDGTYTIDGKLTDEE